MDPKHFTIFDKVLQHDFTKDLSELVNLVKPLITDPEKTRFIVVSDTG